MPEPTPTPPPSPPPPPSDLRHAWLSFVKSTTILLVPVPEDRPLDQFIAFRDKVLTMVQDERFLGELDRAWAPKTDYPQVAVGEALLEELRAFPRAVEVAETTAASSSEKSSWLKRLLGRASTVAGSAKDLLEDLPPWAKMTITTFKELLDIFAGKS